MSEVRVEFKELYKSCFFFLNGYNLLNSEASRKARKNIQDIPNNLHIIIYKGDMKVNSGNYLLLQLLLQLLTISKLSKPCSQKVWLCYKALVSKFTAILI